MHLNTTLYWIWYRSVQNLSQFPHKLIKPDSRLWDIINHLAEKRIKDYRRVNHKNRISRIANTPTRSITDEGSHAIAQKFSSCEDVERFGKYSGNAKNHPRLREFKVVVFKINHPLPKEEGGRDHRVNHILTLYSGHNPQGIGHDHPRTFLIGYLDSVQLVDSYNRKDHPRLE